MVTKRPPKKVIHILCHTIPLNEEYIFNGFSSRMAKNLIKYGDRYKNECWYAINNIKKEMVWHRQGITYRLFPAFTLSKMAESFFGLVFSKPLTEALIRERRNTRTIFHIQGERGLLVWKIINVVKGRLIIIQFHGYRGIWFLRLIEKWIVEVGEKYLFKHVSYFLVHFETRIEYLINFCNIPKEKIIFQNLGVDYEIFKPANKRNAKKELGLPLDKKIILHVGGGIKNKGIDKIIKAHKMIKVKYNTFLILVGVSKDHPLYEDCKKGSDLLVEWVPHQMMPKYFNASDVYCMVTPKEKRKYGGLGISTMEAMACNVPAISSNISDVPDKIKNKIGLEAVDELSLTAGLIKIFKKEVVFKNIRKITEEYFSWKIVTAKILKAYDSFDPNKV